MYIVAIAWGYVILMMAITADSVASGIATAFFLGVLPLALFVYVADSGRRRRRREAAEEAASVRVAVADERAEQRDAADPQPDQR